MPNPETCDRVMLFRHRVSRILFEKNFYDYPVSLKLETFKNMGLWNTLIVGCSYLKAVVFKRAEDNLENFYINRFGKKLYSMFFEYYTENLWGRHPREIDASWGKQRVKGLSIVGILKDILGKIFVKDNRKVETSLIEQFRYPKLGPGQLWETVAAEVQDRGGRILFGSKVVGLERGPKGDITKVIFEKDGERTAMEGDIVLSSMPLKDLVECMPHVPDQVREVAGGLPYRDFVTVGLLVPSLNLKNETDIRTLNNLIPDCWIYVQDTGVKLGRIQIFNNWSPYMVENPDERVFIGLEYFCQEGDGFWNMTEEECAQFAIGELVEMGILGSKEDVLGFHRERVKKAYPAYFDTYDRIDEVIAYLNKECGNLYCIGRNGQHRYNNMDHSMGTAFEAVKDILAGGKDKSNVWNVNTEKEYHEER